MFAPSQQEVDRLIWRSKWLGPFLCEADLYEFLFHWVGPRRPHGGATRRVCCRYSPRHPLHRLLRDPSRTTVPRSALKVRTQSAPPSVTVALSIPSPPVQMSLIETGHTGARRKRLVPSSRNRDREVAAASSPSKRCWSSICRWWLNINDADDHGPANKIGLSTSSTFTAQPASASPTLSWAITGQLINNNVEPA